MKKLNMDGKFVKIMEAYGIDTTNVSLNKDGSINCNEHGNWTYSSSKEIAYQNRETTQSSWKINDDKLEFLERKNINLESKNEKEIEIIIDGKLNPLYFKNVKEEAEKYAKEILNNNGLVNYSKPTNEIIEVKVLVTKNNDEKVEEFLMIEPNKILSIEEIVIKRFDNRIDISEYQILENKKFNFGSSLDKEFLKDITPNLVKELNSFLNQDIKSIWLDAGSSIYDLHFEIGINKDKSSSALEYTDFYFDISKDKKTLVPYLNGTGDLSEVVSKDTVEKLIKAIDKVKSVRELEDKKDIKKTSTIKKKIKKDDLER